jgi:hypothetical protein
MRARERSRALAREVRIIYLIFCEIGVPRRMREEHEPRQAEQSPNERVKPYGDSLVGQWAREPVQAPLGLLDWPIADPDPSPGFGWRRPCGSARSRPDRCTRPRTPGRSATPPAGHPAVTGLGLVRFEITYEECDDDCDDGVAEGRGTAGVRTRCLAFPLSHVALAFSCQRVDCARCQTWPVDGVWLCQLD